jgi:hypothetical protein
LFVAINKEKNNNEILKKYDILLEFLFPSVQLEFQLIVSIKEIV